MTATVTIFLLASGFIHNPVTGTRRSKYHRLAEHGIAEIVRWFGQGDPSGRQWCCHVRIVRTLMIASSYQIEKQNYALSVHDHSHGKQLLVQGCDVDFSWQFRAELHQPIRMATLTLSPYRF